MVRHESQVTREALSSSHCGCALIRALAWGGGGPGCGMPECGAPCLLAVLAPWRMFAVCARLPMSTERLNPCQTPRELSDQHSHDPHHNANTKAMHAARRKHASLQALRDRGHSICAICATCVGQYRQEEQQQSPVQRPHSALAPGQRLSAPHSASERRALPGSWGPSLHHAHAFEL